MLPLPRAPSCDATTERASRAQLIAERSRSIRRLAPLDRAAFQWRLRCRDIASGEDRIDRCRDIVFARLLRVLPVVIERAVIAELSIVIEDEELRRMCRAER